jgi:hypothetical protein
VRENEREARKEVEGERCRKGHRRNKRSTEAWEKKAGGMVGEEGGGRMVGRGNGQKE